MVDRHKSSSPSHRQDSSVANAQVNLSDGEDNSLASNINLDNLASTHNKMNAQSNDQAARDSRWQMNNQISRSVKRKRSRGKMVSAGENQKDTIVANKTINLTQKVPQALA